MSGHLILLPNSGSGSCIFTNQEADIIALSAALVSQTYLAWIVKQIGDPDGLTQDPEYSGS